MSGGDDFKTIRVLHNMARSGGTLISRCLGAMEGIALLSEIHPAGLRLFHPLKQATRWYGLLSLEELTHFQDLNFLDAIELVWNRCEESKLTLVIRDWTHLDFTAVPFLPYPSCRLSTAELLSERFKVINTAIVRHPIDQWLSLSGLELMVGKIDVATFLRGYRLFAEQCLQIGFVRFEDITSDPDTNLQLLCKRLDINYDAEYRYRWGTYTNITGDTPGASRAGDEIRAIPRKAISAALLREFEENSDYQEAIRMLGYS